MSMPVSTVRYVNTIIEMISIELKYTMCFGDNTIQQTADVYSIC